MSEEKKLYAVLAFLLIYGLSSVFSIGSFVLPLPLFEIALALIALSFLPDLWRKRKLEAGLLALFALSHVFSRTYNYQFFIGDEGLATIDKGIIPDSLLILSYLSLMALSYLKLRTEKIKPLAIFICLGFFVFGVIMNFELLLLPLFIYLVAHYSKTKTLFIESNSFWIYPGLFILLRIGSLFIFGSI